MTGDPATVCWHLRRISAQIDLRQHFASDSDRASKKVLTEQDLWVISWSQI
ncbi:hypothetical protein RBWH47_04403 [Rhodopirellula baltica WH47]|uniref:Uncharacterized protein n=1 Tax=Rhodopirellula baltica WH47 TaxID=991778 RepID=F2AR90_RHOBT|nr:hypothetical protein RBWH47_04403 [Rhodopirellula baltica WH47]